MQTIDFTVLGVSQGDRVLDLGCGEGRHVIALACEPGVKAVGIDLGYQDLSTAKSRMADCAEFKHPDSQFLIAQSDGLKLPFADHSFDRVIISEVLEHIPDWQAMLNEGKRVLKPGGHLAVSVPRAWPERLCWWLSEAYHSVPGGHIRIFNANELSNTITAAGFTRYKRHYAHALHVPYWWLKCLFWSETKDAWPVRMYHRLLVWDLMKRPRVTRIIERLLNPVMGKSIVFYFTKESS